MVVKAIALALLVAIIASVLVLAILWYLDRRSSEDHEEKVIHKEQRHDEYMRVYEEDEDVR